MDVILPAAGNALRMRGIPKFLLPMNYDGLSLIESHILNVPPEIERILIPVNPIFLEILQRSVSKYERVVVFPLETETMSQTVLETVTKFEVKKFWLFLPDSVFIGGNPYALVSEDEHKIKLLLWKIRNSQRGKLGQVQVIENGEVVDIVDKDESCSYELAWGAVYMDEQHTHLINPLDPHIGYAIRSALKSDTPILAQRVGGNYFDCGTPSEYFEYLLAVKHSSI